MTTTLIHSGAVVDPSQNLHAPMDILIHDGCIARLGQSLSHEPHEHTFDASGLFITPGFIDIHAHLREPGGESSETIHSGARAAAAGGFTTVFAMPNTNPTCDSPLIARSTLDRSRQARAARVIPIGSVTKGLAGEELTDYSALQAAGVGALSDDGRPVANADRMRRALELAAQLDLVILDHCEDLSLTGAGVMHEGVISLRLGVSGIPRQAESLIVARDGALSAMTGGRLHICHVSNIESIEAIRHWKSRGAPITAEVSPHHLLLTDERLANYDTNAKMKPPLCEESDRQALIKALEDGTIDCIATDHAPHSQQSKHTTLDAAPFGILGFQTAFPAIYEGFVVPGRWSLDFLVEKLTIAPARVVNLDSQGAGALTPGSAADITLLDLNSPWRLTEDCILSRSTNTPWLGAQFRAQAAGVFVDGRLVHASETFANRIAKARDIEQHAR